MGPPLAHDAALVRSMTNVGSTGRQDWPVREKRAGGGPSPPDAVDSPSRLPSPRIRNHDARPSPPYMPARHLVALPAGLRAALCGAARAPRITAPPPRPARRGRGRGRPRRTHLGNALVVPLAEHRPGARIRAHRGHRRRPHRPQHLVRRGFLRERLEDGQRGDHLGPDLRQLRLLFDRRDRARPQRSSHPLGRHRREQRAALDGIRRRGLQVGRRRALLPQHGAGDVSAHRHDRRSPRRFPHGVSWPRRVPFGPPAGSAGCTAPRTAARTGSWSSRSTSTPASTRSTSTRATRRDVRVVVAAAPRTSGR